jgi:hypothetical protein
MLQGYKSPSQREKGFLKSPVRLTKKRVQRFYVNPNSPDDFYTILESKDNKNVLLSDYKKQFKAIEQKRATKKAEEVLESYMPLDVAKMVTPFVSNTLNPQIDERDKYGYDNSYYVLSNFKRPQFLGSANI